MEQYIGSQQHFEDRVNDDYDERERINKQQEKEMIEQCYKDINIYNNETMRINDRIFKAIGNQIGHGFLKDLSELIEDAGCQHRFRIVDEPNGKYQSESDFGCITGNWVTQYSVGMEGDSYEGTIWVKFKNYKYLEMDFSC